MKRILPLLLLLPIKSFAYSFGEHKDIGDQAFRVAAEKMVLSGAYSNHEEMKDVLARILEMKSDPETIFYYFDPLSQDPNRVTYGAINALSGDHEPDPMTLEDKLHDKNSSTNKTLFLHNKYLREFRTGAPDLELFDVDVGYGLLALVNYSHFYDYARTFDEH